MGGYEFGLLGPLSGRHDGREVDLGSPLQTYSRAAEALAVCAAVRQAVVAELGMDPSPRRVRTGPK